MNPFKISVFVNCLILGIYSLGWSYDYQTLSLEYISTIFIINCVNLIFGILISPYCKTNFIYKKIPSKINRTKKKLHQVWQKIPNWGYRRGIPWVLYTLWDSEDHSSGSLTPKLNFIPPSPLLENCTRHGEQK